MVRHHRKAELAPEGPGLLGELGEGLPGHFLPLLPEGGPEPVGPAPVDHEEPVLLGKPGRAGPGGKVCGGGVSTKGKVNRALRHSRFEGPVYPARQPQSPYGLSGLQPGWVKPPTPSTSSRNPLTGLSGLQPIDEPGTFWSEYSEVAIPLRG